MVAGVSTVRIIVWQDERAAIVVHSLTCLPNGFGFTVTAHARHGLPVHQLPPHDDLGLPETVRVGVVFPDGRAVFSDAPADPDIPGMSVHPTGEPILSSQSVLGNSFRTDRGYFVAPLPPPGPVVLVFTWPLYDLDQVQAVIDAGELSAVAATSITLWPDEPTH